MEPLSLAAMVGLVYAAKSKSKKEKNVVVDNSDNPPAPVLEPPLPDRPQTVHDKMPFFGNNIGLASLDNKARSTVTGAFSGVFNSEDNTAGVIVPKDSPQWNGEVPKSFADIVEGRNPFGSPVNTFADRINQNLSNKMNNLSPVQKQYVGPGIGLGDANVPAYGGFQQLYRVLPTNVNAYKLTTLPGRSGPANATTMGQKGPAEIGKVSKNRPDNTITGADRPTVHSAAQGQGDAIKGNYIHGRYTNTERATRRSETTLRQDGLEYSGALSHVPAPTVQDNPTRNKGDLNTARINDVATPGIHSFHGAYSSMAPTDIRAAPNRGKLERMGNAGRMNLRMSPLNQAGIVTKVKDGATCTLRYGTPGPTGNAVSSGYERPEFYNFNTMKGMANPRATSSSLNVAHTELKNNPYAIVAK